ncbi:basic proline-rich protein [Diplodia corticola]|uniref:Basic proline-rich protein n=1 Tax=Diplodia corticola TaxID=236234 RepID=A0A1J9QKK0_9PEZI|nr:basic proline-rich protein [Diplodia corticola]OJD29008.1 basic proline-rich protein [Diplodia corticola]
MPLQTKRSPRASAPDTTGLRPRFPMPNSSTEDFDNPPRQPVPPKIAARINSSSGTTRARPLSTMPQLVHAHPGPLKRDDAPLRVRTKARLTRMAHKVKKLVLGRKRAGCPSAEEAQCACVLYAPDGWRWCAYDEHVAEALSGKGGRGYVDLTDLFWIGVLTVCR